MSTSVPGNPRVDVAFKLKITTLEHDLMEFYDECQEKVVIDGKISKQDIITNLDRKTAEYGQDCVASCSEVLEQLNNLLSERIRIHEKQGGKAPS